MLAKAAASLDLLTGGRVELGLGAGAFWDPIAAMGGIRRTPGEAVSALGEAIDVMRLWWSGERAVRYDGRHYSLNGAHPGPVPAHPIGIWLGAYGPKMLELVGSKADGWVPSLGNLSMQELEAAADRIDQAAAAADRDPASIRRVLNVGGDRSVDEWTDLITTLAVEQGFDGFVFGGGQQDLQRVAEDIAPAVREQVERSRA